MAPAAARDDMILGFSFWVERKSNRKEKWRVLYWENPNPISLLGFLLESTCGPETRIKDLSRLLGRVLAEADPGPMKEGPVTSFHFFLMVTIYHFLSWFDQLSASQNSNVLEKMGLIDIEGTFVKRRKRILSYEDSFHLKRANTSSGKIFNKSSMFRWRENSYNL